MPFFPCSGITGPCANPTLTSQPPHLPVSHTYIITSTLPVHHPRHHTASPAAFTPDLSSLSHCSFPVVLKLLLYHQIHLQSLSSTWFITYLVSTLSFQLLLSSDKRNSSCKCWYFSLESYCIEFFLYLCICCSWCALLRASTLRAYYSCWDERLSGTGQEPGFPSMPTGPSKVSLFLYIFIYSILQYMLYSQ